MAFLDSDSCVDFVGEVIEFLNEGHCAFLEWPVPGDVFGWVVGVDGFDVVVQWHLGGDGFVEDAGAMPDGVVGGEEVLVVLAVGDEPLAYALMRVGLLFG